ncbi:MAG TPA: hypothetical protein PKI66_00435 [Methanobacteriaceae archaeon]|nr:hypothetical protein [Methanobacteriaceae archaeon]HNS25437.1 hypothetical protein [Methanobacteriaceae archaeon]
MGYLICDICEGYYELQPEEKWEILIKCRCGGKLSWVAKLPTQYQEENIPDKKDEKATNLFPCHDCGHKISRTAKSCLNCGYKLIYTDQHGKPQSTIETLLYLSAGAFIYSYFIGENAWLYWVIVVVIVNYR